MKKGILDDKLKVKLTENKHTATERAKLLSEFDNPSTNVYCLIEELETVKT